MTQPIIFDYKQLAHQKNRCARHFKTYNFLFTAAAQDLNDRLGCIQRDFSSVLELNAHGNCLRDHLLFSTLPTRYDTTYFAKNLQPDQMQAGNHYFVETPEILPTREPSYDLIIANLNLHWINNLALFLSNIRRCLVPDGLFLANLVGGASLQTIRHLLMQCDLDYFSGAAPRISPMIEIKDMGHLIQQAGFKLPVIDKDSYPLSYQSFGDLCRDLRGMGEGNALQDRHISNMSSPYLVNVSTAFKNHLPKDPDNPDTRRIVPMEILTITAWAHAPTQSKPLLPGSADRPLQDILT